MLLTESATEESSHSLQIPEGYMYQHQAYLMAYKTNGNKDEVYEVIFTDKGHYAIDYTSERKEGPILLSETICKRLKELSFLDMKFLDMESQPHVK